MIQKKPKGGAQLVGTNKSWPGEGKRVKVGKMNPGKTGEFDTKVKKKDLAHQKPFKVLVAVRRHYTMAQL